MQYLPSSSLYGFQQYPLIEGGEDIDLTIHNVRQYVDLHLDFMLSNGIEKQIDAVRGNDWWQTAFTSEVFWRFISFYLCDVHNKWQEYK